MPKRRSLGVVEIISNDSDGAHSEDVKAAACQRDSTISHQLVRNRLDILRWCGLPAALLAMVEGRLACPGPGLFLAEYFAGVASICFGFSCFGMQSERFDKNYSDTMDLNTVEGFATALTFLVVTFQCGLTWAAPPCSSWVFLSAGTTKRKKTNPMGDCENEKVVWNNKLVHKLACLLEFASMFGIYFIIEQPTSSILWQHPRIQQMFQRLGTQVINTHTYMGMYGGDSEKGMKLYGTAPFLAELKDTMDKKVAAKLPQKELVKRTRLSSGRISISGGADLKASQAYPRRFGIRVAEAYHGYVTSRIAPMPVCMAPVRLSQEDVDLLSCSLPMPKGI